MKLLVEDGNLTIKANRDELLRMAVELIELAKTAKQPYGRKSVTFVNEERSSALAIDGIAFRRA